MKWKAWLPAAALAGLIVPGLGASTISGSFNIAATINVTQDTISWTENESPFTADKAIIGPGATGSFAGLDGTTITIHDLSRTTEPVGSTFGPDSFITFDAAPMLPALDIDFIFDGIYSSAGCTATPPAPGQQCTPGPPVTPSASPFNFVNNPPPDAPAATATFAFQGVVAGTSAIWNGNFTSQFSIPFQSVLSEFSKNGSISNTISATFSVVNTPEPGSFALIGLGLGFVLFGRSLGLISRKKRAA